MDAPGYGGAKMRERLVDIYYHGHLPVKGGMLAEAPFEKLRAVGKQRRVNGAEGPNGSRLIGSVLVARRAGRRADRMNGGQANVERD